MHSPRSPAAPWLRVWPVNAARGEEGMHGEGCNYWLENPLGISRDAFGDFYCHEECTYVCVCVCGKTCQPVACGLLGNLNQP